MNFLLYKKPSGLDAHSAQGYMVAQATAPRRENVPRHILFCVIGNSDEFPKKGEIICE